MVVDGFPRTIPQAEALVKAGIPIDDVVEIAVPDEVILERMSGRRGCKRRVQLSGGWGIRLPLCAIRERHIKEQCP